MMEWFAVQRYLQTVFHIIFFLCLKDFFSLYQGSIKPLFIAFVASVAVLACGFVGSWFALAEPLASDSKQWFRHPPFNAHIRITGFLVASGTVALAPFFAEKIKHKALVAFYYVTGLLIWGLMFWAGGRGSILSVVCVCAAIAVVLKLKGQPIRHYLIATGVFVVGGMILAELFQVFYWNGIFQAAERTMAAGGNPYKMTTGRITFCGWVVETLNNEKSWLFGLGSQGYCFMPNRTFAFQPHNLFFQFLAEWGVVGGVLFMALIGYGFISGAKQNLVKNMKKLSVSKLAALGIILSLGIHSLVDGIFYHAQPSMHLAIAFAVWMVNDRSVSVSHELEARCTCVIL